MTDLSTSSASTARRRQSMPSNEEAVGGDGSQHDIAAGLVG